MSPSSIGSMKSLASTTVIFVPKAAYAHANSIPITPPPMMTMLSGIFSRLNAPVESIQQGFSFTPGIGGTAFTEPAATMIASAVMLSFVPSAFVTSSILGPVKAAVPSTFVILFILKRPATPLVSLAEMAFLCAITCVKFTETPLVSTPISFP